MASTYSSNLKLELMGTGDQSGTWGDTTNLNLGTLLEQAIVGYTTQAITDGADTVLTIANGASSTARNYILELTGTLSANRNLIVPAIEKSYIIYNNTSGGFAVTVKVSGQTGVAVAAGKKAIVYNNGTDIVEVVNAPVTETGTQTLTNKTLTSPTLTTPTLSGTASGTTAGRLGYSSGVFSYGNGSAQRTVVNTDESQTLTNKTLTTPVLSGTASGTVSGSVGYLSGALSYGTGTVQRTVVNTDESQTLTNKTISTGGVWNGNAIGTAYGGTALTGFTAANNAIYSTSSSALTAGTLPVAAGGTGATTLTANNVLLGNGTSALQAVAPGTSGNVLTSNGTTWASAAPAGGDYVSLTSGTATNVSQLDLVLSSYTAYTDFVIVIRELVGATANTGNLRLRTSTDGGSTFSSGTSDYAYRSFTVQKAGTNNPVYGATSTGLDYIKITPLDDQGNDDTMYGGSTTDPSIACRITINNALSTVGRKRIEFISYQNTANDQTYIAIGNGYRRANTAVNAIRLLRNSTNNNFTCKYELYGIK